VDVAILTNGDFDCRTDGLVREQESVRAMALLGVDEDHLHFLGYPDGALASLGKRAWHARRLVEGHCVRGATTYAAHGEGRVDAHTRTHGRAAPYTAEALVSDLRELVRTRGPATLIVTHPQDSHPDHAAAYVFVRRALEPLARVPRVLRAIVHNGDCWPTGPQPGGDCPAGAIAPQTTLPPLTGRLAGYLPDVVWPVPAACASPERQRNPKLSAIFAYVSQVRDDPRSYLVSFARKDEPFFAETLVREGQGPWHVAGDLPVAARAGVRKLNVPPADRPLWQPHEAPFTLWLRLRAARTAAASAPALSLSFVDDGLGHGYALVLDRGRASFELRRFEGSAVVVLQTWALPHDVWSRGEKTFALVAAPGSGGILTFTLWADDEHGPHLLGQALDPRPWRQGARLVLEGADREKTRVTLVLAAPPGSAAR